MPSTPIPFYPVHPPHFTHYSLLILPNTPSLSYPVHPSFHRLPALLNFHFKHTNSTIHPPHFTQYPPNLTSKPFPFHYYLTTLLSPDKPGQRDSSNSSISHHALDGVPKQRSQPPRIRTHGQGHTTTLLQSSMLSLQQILCIFMRGGGGGRREREELAEKRELKDYNHVIFRLEHQYLSNKQFQ